MMHRAVLKPGTGTSRSSEREEQPDSTGQERLVIPNRRRAPACGKKPARPEKEIGLHHCACWRARVSSLWRVRPDRTVSANEFEVGALTPAPPRRTGVLWSTCTCPRQEPIARV